ncbi:hypothetical protein C3B59_17180 [Cryobacterium zongtaii]|uniref:Uracil-DNA glycosylase-like domain-containing protein n=1 Tax=Cryobacterium zongtaii TaxID=1259217 RepID=A0A2S3Z5V4_9MICO|nr:hypothetical protein [Cryobacterium zongtaii]POH59628.1 hypothetical protein C3B59_17180 [Cryobacterium zongtaii]
MAEHEWYQTLRAEWKPAHVRLLLIGESAPAADADDLRFFYAPVLTRADNLFRSVVGAAYERPTLKAGEPKAPWLTRLRDDGIYLIDLAPYPVNHLGSGERRRVLRENAPACVAAAGALKPEGIVVCHGPSFEILCQPLRAAGLPLLHEDRIPFPLGNTRAEFIEKFQRALTRMA